MIDFQLQGLSRHNDIFKLILDNFKDSSNDGYDKSGRG